MKKVLSAVLAGATVLSMGAVATFAAQNITMGTDATWELGTSNNISYEKETINGDSVPSGKTIYVVLETDGDTLMNEDDYKISWKKGDNSKMIKSISLVEKAVKAGNDNATRDVAIKIALAEDTTSPDAEYKMNPEITIKDKKNDQKTVLTVKFWIKNEDKSSDDVTLNAGDKAIFLKPTKNEENIVLWEDANREIARLTFDADSDVNAYYPKLSTKWDNALYAEQIGDADAFVVDFVGNPAISSTSRAVLEIYNPFYNDDEDTFDVAVEDIVIYEDVDGELVDVTDKFTAGENEDGDEVLTVKTRTLGKYIITDGTAVVDTGVAEEEVPAEDITAADKANPGTGF